MTVTWSQIRNSCERAPRRDVHTTKPEAESIPAPHMPMLAMPAKGFKQEIGAQGCAQGASRTLGRRWLQSCQASRTADRRQLHQASEIGKLAGDTAAPLPDDPVRVLPDPFCHLDLAIHHALRRRDAVALEVQLDVLAARRLIDHADSEDKLYHVTLQGA
jgi:hypothetical protein